MPTLNWIGKEAVVNHHLQVPFHLLKDVESLSCGDPGSGNLIVQGDNLVALKALLPYYAGQVKCIYIDPPYNTGNEKWSYNDNVNSPIIRDWLGKVVGGEGETLDRHDRWLCMMYPRLALLKQLLREDGAIFISIDDNEIHNLRYLMDDIFGEQNFVACIEWQKIYTVKNSAKYLSEMHDHILFYAKKKSRFSRNLRPRDEETDEDYDNPDNDERGPWISNALQSRNYYSKGTYKIECPSGRIIDGPPTGTYWRVAESKFWKLDKDNRVWWGKDRNGIPRIKKFLSEAKNGVVPITWWTYQFAGSNPTAKTQLRDIIQGEDLFITPKPIELIQRILEIASDRDSLILDSFAGSGTVGHAVTDLNSRDNGCRRFILVEMEPKIAREVTAERVRRVAEGYENAKGEKIDGLGGGFRYCELGEPLFYKDGKIREYVSFDDLARHVYFTETGEPLPRETKTTSPFLGECRGVGIYLLYNGILGDKTAGGGNVLTRAILAKLPKYDGQKVIYCAGCLLGRDRLQAERIIVRQTPYEIKIS